MNPLYAVPNDAPAVQAAIARVKALFASHNLPVDVTQSSDPLILPVTGTDFVSNTTTFTSSEKSFTAISGLLAYYPNVAITEMRTQGLLPPQE